MWVLSQPGLEPSLRQQLETQLWQLYKRIEGPTYVCPKCRETIYKPPSKNYQLKGLTSVLAEYNKEATASDSVAREDDYVWDEYFPEMPRIPKPS